MKALQLAMLIAMFVLGISEIGYSRKEIANAIEVTSVNQSRIIPDYMQEDYLELKSSPNDGAEKVGEVYEGMVFDVLEEQEEDKRNITWCKIRTEQGVEGYVRKNWVFSPFEITIDTLSVTAEVKVRESANSKAAFVGKVNSGEKYIVYDVVTKKQYSGVTWYKIEYAEGKFGYVPKGAVVIN